MPFLTVFPEIYEDILHVPRKCVVQLIPGRYTLPRFAMHHCIRKHPFINRYSWK